MRTSLLLALVSLSAPLALAQEPNELYRFNGSKNLGRAVGSAGDVDRDGHQDFIAAAYFLDGYAEVRSGIDGALLFRISSQADYFGEFVAGGGDVNADGYPDFAVSSRWDPYPQVRIKVYSGKDATLLLDLPIDATAQYSQCLAFAGDVDRDGHDDVLVGTPQASVGHFYDGAVLLFSGRDGSILFEQDGWESSQELGWSVAATGDVNLDGVPDFAYTSLAPGLLRVISGKDFTVLREKTGGSVDLGWSGVHSAGDVNQDGVPDLVLGYRDQALVLSGTDLSTIHAVTGSFSATSGGADIDLDGYPDFALGMQNSIGYIPGQVAAYSGKTGALLWTDDGEQNGDDFGFSIDVVGDANGDGFADVVAGAPDNSYIKLISGNPSPWAVLGGDRGGTHGKPRLRGVGFPSSGIPVEITLKQALENSIAVFIGSLLPVSKRLPSGGTLIPQVHIVGVASTGPIGELDITVPWPAEPASVTHWVQVLILDAQAPGGYSISNAITVTSQ